MLFRFRSSSFTGSDNIARLAGDINERIQLYTIAPGARRVVNDLQRLKETKVF